MKDHYTNLVNVVEALGEGRNRVIFDDLGLPSIMVRIPKLYCDELIPGMPHVAHPAFIAGGREYEEVYISKYPNVIREGRACSLPYVDPEGCVTYDDAVAAARAKGPGWSLTPASLWSALALWCRKNGTEPRGNNCRGSARLYPEEKGIVIGTEDGLPSVTATGSGPLTWYHDRRASGIADLIGNVSEWNAGMRLCRGELQIIPNADCILTDMDLSPESRYWRAILPDGSLVEPEESGFGSGPDENVSAAIEKTGAANGESVPAGKDCAANGAGAPLSGRTLRLDMENGHWILSNHVLDPVDDARGSLFRDMTYDPAVMPDGVPALLKLLTVYPAEDDRSTYAEDLVFANNAQIERICLRGGNWSSGPHSGVFYYAMDAKRTRCLPRLDFRSVWYPPEAGR